MHLSHNQTDSSLNTAMDIEAVQETENEPTAGQTIDTVTAQMQADQKADLSESAKRKQVIALVDEAINFVKNNPFDQAMAAFTHGRDFIRGELYLFVYDMNGVQFASGLDERTVWQNWYKQRDVWHLYGARDDQKG